MWKDWYLLFMGPSKEGASGSLRSSHSSTTPISPAQQSSKMGHVELPVMMPTFTILKNQEASSLLEFVASSWIAGFVAVAFNLVATAELLFAFTFHSAVA